MALMPKKQPTLPPLSVDDLHALDRAGKLDPLLAK